MLNSRNILFGTFFSLAAVLAAGFAPTAAGAQEAASAPSGAQPPVAYASVGELNGILTGLQKTAQDIQSDLEKTRIEKWKTDGATRRQMQANVESVQRNLQSALPEIWRSSTARRKIWGRVSNSTATSMRCTTFLARWWKRRERSDRKTNFRTWATI